MFGDNVNTCCVSAAYTFFSLQLFFKNKGEVSEEAYILFVRKNAIVVLIPKYGLEGTVFFEEKAKPKEGLVFNMEVELSFAKAKLLFFFLKHVT